MSALGAVPFGLMKGTSGLELLLAVQRRDEDGGADLDPEFIRQFYLSVRRLGLDTLIGFDALNSVESILGGHRQTSSVRRGLHAVDRGRAPPMVGHR